MATMRQGTALLNTLRRNDLDARFPNLLDAVLERPASTAKKKVR
ncbi:hypothetical protein [Terriglobus albidus]